MKNELKTIRISKIIHDKLKKFCEKNNLKINKWIESKILEIINKEEK